jgi:hypothetical protein
VILRFPLRLYSLKRLGRRESKLRKREKRRSITQNYIQFSISQQTAFSYEKLRNARGKRGECENKKKNQEKEEKQFSSC